MKSKLSLLVLALLAVSLTQAQGLHFGIKGGANLTKVDGKAMTDEFNYGYQLGGFAEVGLGKKWFIQPEVMWTEYRTRTADDFEDIINFPANGSNRQEVKLNYLAIPITLNYRLLDWFSLHAGPQFGVLLNQDKNLLENGRDAFNAGVVSLVGGAQLNFGGFHITGRYFTNINDISSGDVNEAWKNKGFQVGVGIRIL
ncbi:PorT family protein [Flavihumibacter sp. RY-1]|uniref:PorT family protein n=1 Tax=Flavihumibacter fluminis TaxID=2909236 RepID=A0ABS9BFZ2_9BACT|nr:porin family protein [Flavihumibacter fluminis]MCF1713576.1 PorT family protein [Flavihumibacter fluminis]